MSKPRILLIEDNAQNRALATFLLEEAGMEVIPAVTGAEALEKVQVGVPDLILLDVQLPDIGGYDLLGQLKSRPQVAQVPVVAVTSYAMTGERKRALDLGCAGYIEKPIDTSTFARQVSGFLGRPNTHLKILIVEDRPENVLILREHLEHRGYDVVSTENGRQALERLLERSFDLVITDLLMPEMDGYQLIYTIKSDDRFKHIPVVVYTATYTDAQDKSLAMNLGAADFIIKPAETEPFMNRVGEIIDKAAKGQLPRRAPVSTDEAAYLKKYAERLVQKLEDKVLEADEANQRLAQVNAELEDRVTKATTALRDTIAELNTSNRELEGFAYTVAHDLRAPLRTVRSLITILEDLHGPALPPQARDLCRRLMQNADLMDRLIEDLLEYSRLGSDQLTLAPVSLEGVVNQVLDLFGEPVQKSGAQIEIRPPLPRVIGHEPTLIRIISNLVSNALKFVSPGNTPKIKIFAERTDQRIRMNVCDNGIGIAPEYQNRIFEVFERLHTSESYPGTGVGLAVVKKGSEKMRGSCGVSSQVGQGSCFWIELKAAD